VDVVIFLKLDRFGRKVTVIHDALELLDSHGCAIQSATEPFETRTPVGRLLLNIMATLAEFELDTIRDRFALGRDRNARAGRFINGVLPFGYDVRAGVLVPSERWIPQLEMTEADTARLIFKKIAGRESSGLGIAQWLTAMGVPSQKVWVTKDGTRSTTAQFPMWFGNRISRMIHNPVYMGARVLHHASGDIDQDVAPLVDAQTWRKANEMLGNTGKKGGMKTLKKTFTYLLGGRIFCDSCDAPMQGNIQRNTRNARLYYGCARAPGKRGAQRHGKCQGFPYAPGEAIENKVLSDIDTFMADPKAAVDVLRQKLRERQSEGVEQETLADRMKAQLRELDARKHKVLHQIVRGLIADEDAEKHLEDIARDIATLRAELEVIGARVTISQNLEERLIDLTRTMDTAKERWEQARAANNREVLREVIELLLGSVRVHADKTATLNYLTPSLSSTKWFDNVPDKDGPVYLTLRMWGLDSVA
jgi:site-specific DNA recombinase